MGLEGNGVNVTSSYLVNRAVYDTVNSEVLISKSTWPLKLSGFVFAGLLIVGRSASYGDVTWTPAYHAASSPLQILVVGKSNPPPNTPVPKSNGNIDPSAAVKRSAAEEVLAFNAGDSGEGGDGGGHDGNHSHDGTSGGGDHSTTSKSQHSNENDSQGSAHTGAAGTASGSAQSTAHASGAAGTAAGSNQSTGHQTGAAGTGPRSPPPSGPKSGAAGAGPPAPPPEPRQQRRRRAGRRGPHTRGAAS